MARNLCGALTRSCARPARGAVARLVASGAKAARERARGGRARRGDRRSASSTTPGRARGRRVRTASWPRGAAHGHRTHSTIHPNGPRARAQAGPARRAGGRRPDERWTCVTEQKRLALHGGRAPRRSPRAPTARVLAARSPLRRRRSGRRGEALQQPWCSSRPGRATSTLPSSAVPSARRRDAAPGARLDPETTTRAPSSRRAPRSRAIRPMRRLRERSRR